MEFKVKKEQKMRKKQKQNIYGTVVIFSSRTIKCIMC